jgi:hypothetical protein
MVDTKVANASCTYPSNVFYTNVSITSSTNNFLNGKPFSNIIYMPTFGIKWIPPSSRVKNLDDQ